MHFVLGLFGKFGIRIFEDTKEVIRSRKSKKNRQYNGQKKKRTKGQTLISKILYRKLKNGQNEPNYPGVNSGAPEGLVVPAPLVAPVVLLSTTRT